MMSESWQRGAGKGTWGLLEKHSCTDPKYLESQWLIIMGYFKPIMVYFGV